MNIDDYIIAKCMSEDTSAFELNELENITKDSFIRYCIACNRNTSAKTLNQLANDLRASTKYEVIHHPNISKETLLKLTNDNPLIIRKSAIEKLKVKYNEIIS